MATHARQQYNADETTLQKQLKEFSIQDDVREKIQGIEEGAQVNTIETINVNGSEVLPDENKAIDLTIPGVVDSLDSTSSTDALSAKQGKVLYDYIQDVSHIGHFLALWNASTGLPVTNPDTSPYIYNTGDFYTISVVASGGGTNYRPDGTQYVIGQASTTVETENVSVNDFYFYDGTTWRHMVNSGTGSIAIDGSLSTTSTNPVENRVITNAINGKQDTLIAGTNIQIAADGKTISSTDTTYTAGTGISIDANNVISNTQTSAEWGNITGTLSDQTDLQNALNAKADDTDLNTKTFYINGTSDLTNAQAAYDWLQDGKNPIIDFSGTIYTYWRSTAGGNSIGFRSSRINSVVPQGNNISNITIDYVTIIASNGTVTSIIAAEDLPAANYLDTNVDYQTPYTPTYDGSPATKKYVDDVSGNIRTFVQNASFNAQDLYDWIRSGKFALYEIQITLQGPNSVNKIFNTKILFGPTAIDTGDIFSYVTRENTIASENTVLYDHSVQYKITVSNGTVTNFTDFLTPESSYSTNYNLLASQASAPTTPAAGSAWYDTNNNVLKLYNGTSWQVVGKEYNAGKGIEIGTVSDYSAMQGPAPTGYHVPSTDEWAALCGILTSTFSMDANATTMGTYLKMPMAGSRGASSNISGVGSNGRYWSSTVRSSDSAYRLGFDSSSLNPQDSSSRATGFSIRCFKDTPTIPDSSWTTLYDGSSIATGAGVFYNTIDGLISVSGNGQTWYTIQDKNLGATIVFNQGDTVSDANCGYFYQWGNNYGFAHSGTITTSSTQVDASSYGPGNYYNSSTFITRSSTPRDWTSVRNDNLWGGVTGVVTLDNVISNTGVTSVNGQTGDITIEGGDVKYSDFAWDTATGATVTLDLNTEITPSANFTVNAPATIKDGQTYILRVTNGATAYTMTLGTNITNPYNTDLTLTANGVDQFVFLAIGGNLELQPDAEGGSGITKIFTLSSTSDLTNAQAAHDRVIGGGNALIKIGSNNSIFSFGTTTTAEMRFYSVKNLGAVSNSTWANFTSYKFTLSSGTVTAVTAYVNNINISSTAPSSGTNAVITIVI